MEKEYICLRCNKSFGKFKTHLKNHLLRKNKCNPIDYNIDCKDLLEKLEDNIYIKYSKNLKNKCKCPFCDKNYNHKSSLSRHKKDCVHNPKNINKSNEQQIISTTNNVTNNIQNQINININSFGNEEYDIKKITKQLNFVLGYSNFNGNQLHFKDRIDNMIENYNVIFDHIYENPKNHNFNIVNKKNKICKIKDSDTENYIHIHFDELVDKIFNIVYKIFDLSIDDFEFQNDTICLEHYKEFQQKNIERKNKYIQQYYSQLILQKKIT